MAVTLDGVSYTTQILKLSLRWDDVLGVHSKNDTISYNGTAYGLTKELKIKLYDSIPEIFKSDKEKISKFVVTSNEDGSIDYFLETYKTVFDFRKREYINEYRNSSNQYTEFQYEQLKNYLIKFYTELALDQFSDLSEKITNKLRSKISIKTRILEHRDTLLSNSDKYMLPDYPISDAKREEWKIYRQKLRDLTNQPSWRDDVINIEFPASPDDDKFFETLVFAAPNMENLLREHIFNTEISKEEISELCKGIVNMTVKLDILTELSKINIPEFQSIGDFTNMLNLRSLEDVESTERVKMLRQIIEDKLSIIDNILEEANMEFRVSDILNTVINNEDYYDPRDPDVAEALDILEGI